MLVKKLFSSNRVGPIFFLKINVFKMLCPFKNRLLPSHCKDKKKSNFRKSVMQITVKHFSHHYVNTI